MVLLLCPVINLTALVIVADARHPVYGSYAQIAIDFINQQQSLSIEPNPQGPRFLLQHATAEVPHNDSDATFTQGTKRSHAGELLYMQTT